MPSITAMEGNETKKNESAKSDNSEWIREDNGSISKWQSIPNLNDIKKKKGGFEQQKNTTRMTRRPWGRPEWNARKMKRMPLFD